MEIAVVQWNNHRIRKTKNQNMPNGRPTTLYHMPQQFGGRESLCPCAAVDINACFTRFNVELDDEDAECFELYKMILEENGWQKPSKSLDMIDFYSMLRQEVRDVLM